jgi:hypothetical protein
MFMKDAPYCEFLQGAAMVLAELSRIDGPELARYLVDQCELSLSDFVAANVHESDLAELRRAFALNSAPDVDPSVKPADIRQS